MRQKRMLLVVMVLTVAGIASFYSIQTHPIDPIPLYQPGEGYSNVISFWEEKIRIKGGATAYIELGVAIRNLTDAQQHTYAHLFGAALYKIDGINGFSVCDNKYSAGCYHQFLGSAVQDLGFSSLPMLAARCKDVEEPGGCGHGMGHVILSLLGYDFSDLQKTLTICDEDFVGHLWFSCIDGAIMEYNVRDVGVGEGIAAAATGRPLTKGNLYTPCLSLSPRFQSICANELPRWWLIMGAGSSTPEWLGAACNELQIKLALACFEGIGFNIAANMQPDQVSAECEEASRGEGAITCLFGAARRYTIDHPEAPSWCSQFKLNARDLSLCNDFATYKSIMPDWPTNTL